jgi:hypothetical protein
MASFTEWETDDLVFLRNVKFIEEIQQAAHVMDEWFGVGGEPVDPELASKRANICFSCPNNAPDDSWWKKSKSVAAGVIKNHIGLKHSMRLSTPRDGDIHSCLVCGCVLQLKVHVPIKFAVSNMTPEQKEEFTKADCWLINEQG